MTTIKSKLVAGVNKAAQAVVKATKPKPAAEPLPICAVRFEADLGKWAVLDSDNNVLESFSHGVMTDVHFETRTVTTRRSSGCGFTNDSTSFGIAVGQLKKDTHGRASVGFQNLTYTNNRFADAEGQPLEKASIVRLMHDRKSLFRA